MSTPLWRLGFDLVERPLATFTFNKSSRFWSRVWRWTARCFESGNQWTRGR